MSASCQSRPTHLQQTVSLFEHLVASSGSGRAMGDYLAAAPERRQCHPCPNVQRTVRFLMRKISQEVKRRERPVGATPNKVPPCVPVYTKLAATMSLEATVASTATWRPGAHEAFRPRHALQISSEAAALETNAARAVPIRVPRAVLRQSAFCSAHCRSLGPTDCSSTAYLDLASRSGRCGRPR
jgi:hypothetical protein